MGTLYGLNTLFMSADYVRERLSIFGMRFRNGSVNGQVKSEGLIDIIWKRYAWMIMLGLLLLITLPFWKLFMEYLQRTFFICMEKFQ